MDNLPKDPPDSNNNSAFPTDSPSPFGSSFNPHTNPVDPNNPYQSQPLQPPAPISPNTPASPTQRGEPNSPNLPEHPEHSVHSEVAEHRPRDAHGHFLPYEHPNLPQTPPAPQTAPASPAGGPTSSNPSAPPNPSSIPPIIEINQNTEPSSKKDPPLFGFFLTNPVTYLKLFLNRLIKRQAITLKIPVLAILIILVGIGGFGIGFQSGINWSLARLFPNYSPILRRPIAEQGIIQKSSKGYYLKSDNKDKTLWTLKSVSANVKLEDYVGQQVQIKGNLTPTPNLIEVSEVISFDPKPSPTPAVSAIPSVPSPNSLDTPNSPNLPNLYSGLTWEVTQSKTLLFTSGKRRIEQEGVYLESAQVTDYPQAFMDYYTGELTNSGFKQTFNSSNPNGTTITYAKDELFLTYGVKNIFQGSGDNKKLVGYKAFIEHN